MLGLGTIRTARRQSDVSGEPAEEVDRAGFAWTAPAIRADEANRTRRAVTDAANNRIRDERRRNEVNMAIS
jgi:hypothetical protein